MLGPTSTTPSVTFSPGTEVDVLAEREHQRIGLDGFELAGGLRETLAVESHLFDGQRGLMRLFDS